MDPAGDMLETRHDPLGQEMATSPNGRNWPGVERKRVQEEKDSIENNVEDVLDNRSSNLENKKPASPLVLTIATVRPTPAATPSLPASLMKMLFVYQLLKRPRCDYFRRSDPACETPI